MNFTINELVLLVLAWHVFGALANVTLGITQYYVGSWMKTQQMKALNKIPNVVREVQDEK